MLQLTSSDPNHHRVSGSPTLMNAKQSRALLDAVFAEAETEKAQQTDASAAAQTIEVSLADISNGNSVLVSLMLVWMRRARHTGVDIRFVDVPPLVSNLIEFTGLDDVLPVAGAAA